MEELFAPALNFSLLVILLFVLLRKPVTQMVRSRHQGIKDFVSEAQAQKAEADRRYRELNEKLAAFEGEAKLILDRAQKDAEEMKAKIISDAHASAARIIKESESLASSNVQEFKDKIRKETISKAVEIAERMIKDRLSSDDQKRIVNEYVGKVQ